MVLNYLQRITNLRVAYVATINEKAMVAIKEANVIILGSGDLYTIG